MLHRIPNPNILALDKSKIGAAQARLARGGIPSRVCLERSNFLLFNSCGTAFLIFDVDSVPGADPGGRVAAFQRRHDELLRLVPPTWIIGTDRGVHVAWALSNQIPQGATARTRNFLAAITRAIAARIGADPCALRRSGVWRNPLRHVGEFRVAAYRLGDLWAAVGGVAPPPAPGPGAAPVTALAGRRRISGWEAGGRNTALYWECVREINKFPHSYTEGELGDFAVAVNAAQSVPLPPAEAHKTGRSAWRQYQVFGRRLGPSSSSDGRRPGPRPGTPEAAQNARNARSVRTRSAVSRAVEILERSGQPITVRAVAAVAGVSVNSARKYLPDCR